MEFRNLEVFGFDVAVRGMRNSFASWNKSDSIASYHHFHMGDNDMALMKRLYKAGGSERKFMRVIQVWCDIYAPLTWWKQFDTYKISTTNYETAAHIIMDRRNHKLTEWHDFCNYMLDVLPYLKEIMDV